MTFTSSLRQMYVLYLDDCEDLDTMGAHHRFGRNSQLWTAINVHLSQKYVHTVSYGLPESQGLICSWTRE